MADKKPFFDEVQSRVNFPELEKKLFDEWNKKGIVKKYLEKNNSSKKRFSFLDGPITANNPMGVHHAWGRTYKDLWQRFKNMQGHRERFQNGFDCQGLWVEVEVEKELGLRSKKDIENLVKGNKKASIAKFVRLCKERVEKFADIQTEQSKRLGYFMDWDNSYYTLSDENNYMIWRFLKKCNEDGLIYKGRDSVPWCPRCGTAISQHEILTEDYKELTHETVFFKLNVHKKDFSLLVWTTTPWTIPANVAAAVNPKIKYVIWETEDGDKVVTVDPKEIEDEESKKWFEKHLLSEKLKEVKKIDGKKLVGLTYEAPFDSLERVKDAKKENPKTFHTVVAAEDLVVATKGTGILHVAPGAGQEDFRLGKVENLPVIDVIDEEAVYLGKMGEFSGKNAKKHPEVIIDYLKNKAPKFLFKTAPITHRYPACWRCKTELVWRVVDEWYIKIDPVRGNMKKVAKKINWIPKFGLKREIDWLNNMEDWLISKSRYWGLALPIWVCNSCGHFQVIGTKEELKEKAVAGWDKFDGHTPHRPYVDEVKIKCDKCGKIAERIPDVGNPWLDAGIVPYSTIAKDNKGEPLYNTNKKEWEEWFPADFITESFPGQFKNWFYAMIAMSTVLEDREPFDNVLGFGTLLGEDGRPMHKSWGNSIEFNEGADKIGVDVMRWMYAKQNPAENLLFGYHIADETRRRFHLKLWNVYNFFITYANLDGWKPGRKETSSNILDKWILSRLAETIDFVTKNLEKFDAFTSANKIEEFVEDLSNWYIRRSRNRVGAGAKDSAKKEFYETTYEVLEKLTRLLAPFIPYVTDVMYKNLTKETSVHLVEWPTIDDIVVDEELVKKMAVLREVVEKIHALRKDQKIPVRQPLTGAATTSPILFSDELLMIAKNELNIKTLEVKKGDEIEAKLDTKITPALEEEAKTRDLIRKIQQKRKDLDVNLTQEVNVVSPWLPKSKELIQLIKTRCLTKSLTKGEFLVTE